ncbi:hypothetical protein [Paenibacillus qinlingensis]|uniref:Uncharacterized protein n=1 Tax=Paenibacillus qinlingensis TaxID=1837343 RepID=A0ABU1NUH2_9BACL|nr:hypothetical protein [Paenibacillus qinlingensis]MDR6551124.1 hypothetical protein [Paenibacillus qinlingensis]
MKTQHQSKRQQRRGYQGQKSAYGATVKIAAQAKANLGTPVCVVLKDGSYYYGVLKDIQANQVILQGFKGKQKLPRKKGNSKAQISSLGSLGGLGSMLGMFGGGGLGGLLGGGGSGGGLGGLLGGGGSAGGLLGGLGQGAAGKAAGAGAGAGAGGLFGNIGSFMKLGMGVISFIMPLMKNFSI